MIVSFKRKGKIEQLKFRLDEDTILCWRWVSKYTLVIFNHDGRTIIYTVTNCVQFLIKNLKFIHWNIYLPAIFPKHLSQSFCVSHCIKTWSLKIWNIYLYQVYTVLTRTAALLQFYWHRRARVLQHYGDRITEFESQDKQFRPKYLDLFQLIWFLRTYLSFYFFFEKKKYNTNIFCLVLKQNFPPLSSILGMVKKGNYLQPTPHNKNCEKFFQQFYRNKKN